MNRKNPSVWFSMAITALLVLGGTGCAFHVVRPQPLVIGSTETGNRRVVTYPAYVLVHDSESFWDAHQIKDNLFGLTEVDIVHSVDRGIDAMTPGPRHRPVENSIEWIKNDYAQLPDCAPVRIVDGLFSALGIEKTTLIGGAHIVSAPADPLSYFVFTRVIYLTDWVQETLGEVNKGAGYLAPWPGPFVPLTVTAPVNCGVDRTQTGAIALYVYAVHKMNLGLDSMIDMGETTWGGIVGVFVWP